MNKITVSGRVGRDPETRYLTDGKAVLSFSLADDVGFGDKATTNWWNCTIFGKRAESLAAMLNKGKEVTVFGQVNLRKWTDKTGNERLSPDIFVDDIKLHGGKSEGNQEPQQRTEQKKPVPAKIDDFEDEIPW